VEVLDTALEEVKVLRQQRHGDERGWFTRAWCQHEYTDAGLDPVAAQVNFSSTSRRGTVRGLHRQVEPHAEAKTVWVVSGAILDVAVDLRDGSPTRAEHVAAELSADNGLGLHVPKGFAHGFQALTDDVVMVYVMSQFYAPGTEQGVRFDDPTIGIDWPLPVTVLSDKDAALPPLGPPETP
jgi:dTDP-4-dehydrorhamnose 3,5-epimerase